MICIRFAAPLLLASVFALALPGSAEAIPKWPSRAQDARINEILAGASNKAMISEFLGIAAHRCLASSDSVEVCEWRVSDREAGWSPIAAAIDTKRRVAIICALPRDGSPRLKSACVARPRESNRAMFDSRKYRTAAKFKESDVRAHFQRIAQEWIDESLTMVSLSFLLGSVPNRCAAPGEGKQECVWRLDRSKYGHGTVKAALDTRSHGGVRIGCRLPSDGTPRAIEDCSVALDE